jgi:CheY-like chemotaxis protein
MGGRIGVDSEPGVGSTFWFTARLMKASLGGGEQPPPRTELRGLRALVIGANATSRSILARKLDQWGIACETATEEAALPMLWEAVGRGAPFDLAILDRQLPGLDEVALARAIKADPTIAHTPLVVVASAGRRGDARAAAEAGIAAYLNKPEQQSQLADCIAAVLAQPTGGGPRGPVTRHPLEEAMARRGPRVLVVEDNPVNQSGTTPSIRRWPSGSSGTWGIARTSPATGSRPSKPCPVSPMRRC